MGKKKIIIVSSSFYHKNSPRSLRTTELAKEFANQRHKVVILTPKDHEIHPGFEKEYKLTIKDLGQQKWKKPDFGRKGIRYFLTRLAVRFLQLSFEYPDIELMFLVKKALKKEKDYDLLISIAVPYPIHWGVAWARSKNHPIAKIWVADCGDPYMGCKTDSFRKLFYFKYLEKCFMRKADFVSIPVESAKIAYYPEFQKKIRVIPQGVKINGTLYKQNTAKHSVPTFAYAGGFIPGIRDPRPFLNFLESLGEDFRFYVYTRHVDFIKHYEDRLGNKLQIKDFIPREQLLDVLSRMDFLVNFDNNTNTAIPSKLIDYALAGRPVLNIQSELNKGVIHQFLRGDYSQAMKIGPLDQYRIENVCNQFLELAID